jgi:glycosyltransferase involved in cell wall biosynthesis
MASLPEVTVAIPTYNRAALLRQSMASALAQDYPNLHLLVIDNASTDPTAQVVRSFNDPRVSYVRNPANIGQFRNWMSAVTLNNSPYLVVLQDDDLMRPGFVQACVSALEAHPSAGFAATDVDYIDQAGEPFEDETSAYVSDPIPTGRMAGLDLLHQVVAGKKWYIQFSAVMLRAATLARVGTFDAPHSLVMLDWNLYVRLAAASDLVFIGDRLLEVRLHPGQGSHESFRVHGGLGPFAVLAERLDALAHLLRSPRADDPTYRIWLADRLIQLNAVQSELAAELIPGLKQSWEERRAILLDELELLLPPETPFILVDNDTLGVDSVAGRRAIALIERDGTAWGAPEDATIAIAELERKRAAGLGVLVIAWTAFWWLDYYGALREHLAEHYRCSARNSRLIAYDLQDCLAEGSGRAGPSVQSAPRPVSASARPR